MNACTTLPVTIPLHRPLWRRAAGWMAERMGAYGAAAGSAARQPRAALSLGSEPMDLHNAMALNDHLLRDIGVSEMLRDEAAARRGIESMAARVAHGDLAERGRHWYG